MSMSVQQMLEDHEMDMDRYVSVSVVNIELWMPLFGATNEMVALFTGTSMIPDLIVQIHGLDRSFLYAVVLEFKQITDYKWRHINGNWITGGSAARPSDNTVYMHPDSVQSGSSWTKGPIDFKNIKIATSKFAVDTIPPKEKNNIILLNNNHKYMPVVKIFKVGGMFSLVHFQELEFCQFLAVSIYKNNLMFQLKGNAKSEASDYYIKIRKPPLSSCPTYSSGLFQSSQTHLQTRPVGILVSQMIDLKLNPVEEDKIKKLTPLTTTKLFPPDKLNFMNFIDLYKVKKTISGTPYTVSNYVEDIKNKSFRIPNSSLVYEEQLVESFQFCQIECNREEQIDAGGRNAAQLSEIKTSETFATRLEVNKLHNNSIREDEKFEEVITGDERLEGAVKIDEILEVALEGEERFEDTVGEEGRLEGAIGGDERLEGKVADDVNSFKCVHSDLLQDLKENFGDHVINVEENILEEILEAYLLVQEDSYLLDDLSFLDFRED